jgi:hypothetical protein
MTDSLTLATAHGGFPAPLTIVLALAGLGYVLWSRTRGQPLKAKRLLVLPAVLTVIGVTDLTGSSAPHLTPKDIAFLLVTVAISVVLGAARGATIELYPQQGELWQRYRRNTVALWIVLVATKLVLTVIAGAAGASAGGGTKTLLLSLGVSLLAEAAIVAPRALSTGLPFASDHNTSDGGRPGPTRAGRGHPSLINQLLDMAASWERPANSRVDQAVEQPAPPANRGDHHDAPPWRSPRVSDGISWLRYQIDQPAKKAWSQNAPSPRPTDLVRDHHHDHHDRHHHHHGLTGPS